jgi:hypothetical protein
MDDKASLVSAIDSSPRTSGKDFSRSPSVLEAYGRAKAGKQ